MGTPLRSRLQMDARREQLLMLGRRLFASRPYDEIAIDDIAAAANVSKGLLYHYFGSKRDFYVAVVRDAASDLIDAVVPDPTLPPAARVFAGLSAYLGFVEAHADAYAALVTGGLGADPETAAILDHAREAIVGRMMLELGLRHPRPLFRLALRSWIGAVEAASLEWLSDRKIQRHTLLLMLLGTLYGTLVAAIELDPDAGIELPPPDPLLPFSHRFR